MPLEERVIEEEAGIELSNSYDYNYSALAQLASVFFSGAGLGVGDGTSSIEKTLNFKANSKGTGTSKLVDIIRLVNFDANSKGKGTSSSPDIIRLVNFGNQGKGVAFGVATINNVTEINAEKYNESFHIGDAEIPLLVSKDTSVERETVVKNFFKDTSEFFQESSDFESGTYSAFLKQDEHSKGKTVEEQVNDVYQLLQNNPAQNTVDFIDGKGHIAVQSVSDTIDIQGDVREVELDIIFLEEV